MKNTRIEFYRSLLSAIAVPMIATIGISILYVIMMSFLSHKAFPFDYFIIIFAIIKTYLIASVTFKHLSILVKTCYSFERLFAVFGFIIAVTLLSFAIDYSCLFEFQESAFSGLTNYSDSYLAKIPNFIYFSVTTFATVGYGDIVPVSAIAKFLVLLEIFLSFLIIVFALANINKIQVNK